MDHHLEGDSDDVIPSSLSPIHRLPTELLIELCTYCSANDAIAPLTLASVCRLFREVILSSPRVWQLISLDGQRPTVSTSNAQADLWIARSDPLPFDVELNLQCSDALLSLLSPLLPFIDRWRYCWISGAIEERLNLFSLIQPGLVPTLHYLNIDIQSLEDSADASYHPSTFYSCGVYSQIPQHISMNLSFATLPSAKSVNSMQFTTLNITERSLEVHLQPAEILDFLTMCPLLEEFYYSGVLHDEVSTELPNVAHLPHLRILLLRNTCFQRTILSGLDAPALGELHLQNLNLEFELQRHSAAEEGDSDEEDPDYSRSPWSDHHTGISTGQTVYWTIQLTFFFWSGMGLRKLITRSNPPLEVLDMDLSDMRTKDFTWCFDRLSTLRRFRITGSDMSDRVINLFKPVFLPPDDGASLRRVINIRMPRLSALKLYNCQQLSGKAVVDAIGSRVNYTDEMTPDSTFENFTIVDCVDFLPEHIVKLSKDLGRRFRIA